MKCEVPDKLVEEEGPTQRYELSEEMEKIGVRGDWDRRFGWERRKRERGNPNNSPIN